MRKPGPSALGGRGIQHYVSSAVESGHRRFRFAIRKGIGALTLRCAHPRSSAMDSDCTVIDVDCGVGRLRLAVQATQSGCPVRPMGRGAARCAGRAADGSGLGSGESAGICTGCSRCRDDSAGGRPGRVHTGSRPWSNNTPGETSGSGRQKGRRHRRVCRPVGPTVRPRRTGLCGIPRSAAAFAFTSV